jgi:N-methylhydantoinase A/oxoprolinase/acetone carboxylase beta subunit
VLSCHPSGKLHAGRLPSERLEGWGILRRAGLTPTDLLLVASGSAEVLGSLGMTGNQAAAVAGAQVVARQLDLTVEELVQEVVAHVVDRIAQEILDKLVGDETGHGLFPAPPGWEFVLRRALGHGEGDVLDCRVRLPQPIVAIGAPVAGFMPQVAETLHTRCLIPDHAEVGNAVGAVVASVTHTVEILVQPHVVGAGTLTFLVHSPQKRESFPHFPEAVGRAEKLAVELAEEAVHQAGAEDVSVKVDRQEVILGKLSEMTVRATATGRPRIAE